MDEDGILVIEECHATRWTDELPDPEPLMHRFFEQTDRAPPEVVWTMTQVKCGRTV